MANQPKPRLQLVAPKAVNGKPPPHNLDAEAATLSAMILDATTIPIVLAFLTAEDFYSLANALIFRCIRELFELGQGADATTILEYLRNQGKLNEVGGAAYLAQIIDATPAIANVSAHAKIVAKLARRRRLIALAQVIAAEGYEDVPEEWEAGLVSRVEEISRPPADETRTSIREALVAANALIDRMSVQQGDILGVRTPSAALNALLGGLHEREVTLVGGKRGGGKTSMLCQTAINCAQSASWEPWIGDECQMQAAKNQGIDTRTPPERIAVPSGALIFSLEMPKDVLGLRMQFSYGRVNMARARTGQMTPTDWSRFAMAGEMLSPLSIDIDEQPRIRLVQARARVCRVRNEMAKQGVRLRFVGLDYVQIMDVSDMAADEAKPSRERQLADLGQHMITLKKHKDNRFIAWMYLVQTNAAGLVRESQALEQAADNILDIRVEHESAITATMLSRPKPTKIAVTKQRNGPSDDVVETFFHSAYTQFDDREYLAEEVPT